MLPLSNKQLKILKEEDLESTHLSPELIAQIATQANPKDLADEQLLEFLQVCNALYRSGEPLISDADYDFVFLTELQNRHPRHPYLETVEPEISFVGKTVALPVRMLSTDKAYSLKKIKQWVARIKKTTLNLEVKKAYPQLSSEELKALKLPPDELEILELKAENIFDGLTFKITPKLDGFAAYDDGNGLYTRGDGRKGTDISRVFERGLMVGGNGGERGLGAGEIVVTKSYFQEHLSPYFDNARNFQASVIKEKELEQHAQLAIKDRAAVFYPFVLLPCRTVTASELLSELDVIIQEVWGSVDYDVDGVVLEVTDDEVKNYMGETLHHHRWQIAYKENSNSAEVKVLGVTPQTSRSGRITPVAELEPTRLSGALISRATAHHYGMVKEWGIAKDAVIKLTRSGEVIPKIERVLISKYAEIPEQCPSCNSELVWDANDLYCLNTENCPAQIESSIEHFFKTLGNVDGFGEKIIGKLNANGVSTVYDVYQLDLERLTAMGFGEKTAQNLLDELERSRKEPIEDWRFFGAFGMDRMGLGNCERLLQTYSLDSIFNLTQEEIKKIDGFAGKTSEIVFNRLKAIKNDFEKILGLGFNLVSTQASTLNISSPIFNKLLVFTGTMEHAKRDDLIKEAKQLGAKVGTSVTAKTDYLIAGDKVGETKLNDAHKKGVKVITEDEYLALLNK
jgi:DNA ligase (NAD+)